MLIPNKFNGYSFDGSRRCFGGGGGGGGGAGGDGGTGDAASATGDGAVGPGASGTGNGTGDGGSGPGVGGDAGGGGGNTVYTPTYTNTVNTANTGNTSVYGGPGVSTTQGMATLSAMKGTPWGQSGSAYNELLNQGFTSNQIRNSASSMYGAPSDANWGAMVQNAGMTSPTGRPMAGSDQFFQPVYNLQYQNYARPYSQFDTSTYGTQPLNSPLLNQTSRSNVNNKITDFYNTNYRDNPNGVGMGDTLDFMRQNGINRNDFQTYGSVNNYGPQMSMPSAQTQQPFNPYSNNSGFNGQLMTAGYGGFGSPMGGLSPYVTGQMPQMQSPFSFQQPSYQPQMQTQTPFSYQQQSYQPSYQQQSYQPSYQQQSYQPSYQQQSYQQPQQYNPYQMQSPFSYQQPSYGGYSNYDSGYNYQQPTPPPPPTRTSSGPTSPIVGRSSQVRGTPNVMRRAEGGITELLSKAK